MGSLEDTLLAIYRELAEVNRRVGRLEVREGHNFSAINIGTESTAGTGEGFFSGRVKGAAHNTVSGYVAAQNTTWTDVYTPGTNTMGIALMALLSNGAGGSAFRAVASYYKDSGDTLTVDVLATATVNIRGSSGVIQTYQDSGNPQNVMYSVTGTYKG